MPHNATIKKTYNGQLNLIYSFGGDLMAISSEEFQFEKGKLVQVQKWIHDEMIKINKEDTELHEKIASLKKESKGRYSEELETVQKLYDITSKNQQKYDESLKKPYFGRIDFREYRREKEHYYFGKFGLYDDSNGDEIVIDWRAPLADLYYSGTQGQAYYESPGGLINGELSLKRKFLIKNEKLEDAFDEGINEIILKSASQNEDGSALIDEFLKINLEENVSSKLKDVVATIQKEQNDIIRAEKNKVLIVQGSAGSGKTTIALHRLAYLLYKYKNRMSGEDVLVIAPNKLFLDYISELLPNLGVDKVKQKTFEEVALQILNIKSKVISKDKKLSQVMEETDPEKIKYITSSSKIKGSVIFKTILDRYIRYLEKNDINIDDMKYVNYTIFDKNEMKRLFARDMVKFPLNKRKQEIKKYLALKLPGKINDIIAKIDFNYEYTAARIKKNAEDGIERRSMLTEVYDERDRKKKEAKAEIKKAFEKYFNEWILKDIDKLYENLFLNEEIYKEVTEEKIPGKLYEYILQQLKENNENKIIDGDDLAPMLYLKFKVDDIVEKNKFKHIVVDEAQDYSMFQIWIMKMLAINDSLTIVGDIGQGIYYYKGISSWETLINELFKEETAYVALTQSYRSTIEIINFANKILKKQDNNLKPAEPVLRHGKEPQVIKFSGNKELAENIDNIIKASMKDGKNNFAIIGKNGEECKAIKEVLKKYSLFDWELVKDTDKTFKLEKIIIPSYMTKGLEFDCSIIYNCNNENYSDTELNKKLLYVVLTRALHEEYIFYKGEISSLLE